MTKTVKSSHACLNLSFLDHVDNISTSDLTDHNSPPLSDHQKGSTSSPPTPPPAPFPHCALPSLPPPPSPLPTPPKLPKIRYRLTRLYVSQLNTGRRAATCSCAPQGLLHCAYYRHKKAMSCGMMSFLGVNLPNGLGVPMPRGSWAWAWPLASTFCTRSPSSQRLPVQTAQMESAMVPTPA